MKEKKQWIGQDNYNFDNSFLNDKEFENLTDGTKKNKIINDKPSNIRIFLLVALLGVSISTNIALMVNYAEMKDKLFVLENNKSEMELEINNRNIKVEELQHLKDKYDILVSRMLSYLDNRVVFVDDENKHYHRWDCEDLNNKNAVAMDIYGAEAKGYTDCPLCKIGECQKREFDIDNPERSVLSYIENQENRKKELLGKIYK
jgi:hypothetical protein